MRLGQASFLVGGLLVATAPAAYAAGTTERVSVSSSGEQSDRDSYDPALSGNGRVVAFDSLATNLAGITDGQHFNVFVRDRAAGVTTLASPGVGGAVPDGTSFDPVISRDGRLVAFTSVATNLGPGGNGNGAVLLRDLGAGTTELASVTSAGTPATDGNSDALAISASGRYIVFDSNATDLASNHRYNIFVRDRQTGRTTLESVTIHGGPSASTFDPDASLGVTGAAITPDGRYIAFGSDAPDLVTGPAYTHTQIILRDRRTGKNALITVGADGQAGNGNSYYPYISDDGGVIAFDSDATNLVAGSTPGQVYVYDVKAGNIARITKHRRGFSRCVGLSADGRYVLLSSSSDKLVPGDTNYRFDTFLYDRRTRTFLRVSVSSTGAQTERGPFTSLDGALSADGRVAAFATAAGNLVPDDTNEQSDIFVRTR
jgi:Tol biopolymer transport system component